MFVEFLRWLMLKHRFLLLKFPRYLQLVRTVRKLFDR